MTTAKGCKEVDRRAGRWKYLVFDIGRPCLRNYFLFI